MDVGDAKITLGLDTQKFENGLKSVTSKMNTFSQNIGQKMTAVGKQMSMKVTAPLVALGVGAFKMAGDFDTAMRQVNVMLKASGEDFDSYKDQVLDISSSLGKSSDEVAASFYQIVSAGYRGSDAIDILQVAMEGAVGGMADAEQTTAALTKAMNIFSLQGVEGATRAMDVFFGIVDSGLLTFEQMAQAFPRAATMAAGLGVTIEETGAALATLSKVSGSTEQASTALNAVFTQLIKPSESLQNLYKEWGVSTGPEAIEKFGGLEGVLREVQEATGGNVAELSDLFPNVEAIKAILPLVTTNAEDFVTALDTVSDSTGRTGEALAEMTEGPGFKWNQMQTTIKNGMIELGDAISETVGPMLEKLIGWIKGIVEWFEKLPDPMKDMIVKLGGIVIAIGPVLLIGGKMITMIGGFITAGKAMVRFIFLQAIPTLIKLAASFIATLAAMGPAGWIALAGVAAAAAGGIMALTSVLGESGVEAPEGIEVPEPRSAVEIGAEGGTLTPWMPKDTQAILPPGYVWEYKGNSKRAIPSLQFGGIVPGPIGQPVPIIAHGGEQFAGVGNKLGGTTINLNVEGNVVTWEDLVSSMRREFILMGERESTTGFI